MRFETKFDLWLVAVVAAGVTVGCAVPVIVMSQLSAHEAFFWVLPFVPLVGIAALAASWPQYYEVREDGLFIRQGWRRTLLPYASLLELRKESNLYSAPVFSSDRIFISTTTGASLVIAVAEEDRFLSEVLQRDPQLRKQSWGLGMPFSPSTVQ